MLLTGKPKPRGLSAIDNSTTSHVFTKNTIKVLRALADVVRAAQFKPYASTNATPVVLFTPRTIAV
jgi:hypothetical protein